MNWHNWLGFPGWELAKIAKILSLPIIGVWAVKNWLRFDRALKILTITSYALNALMTSQLIKSELDQSRPFGSILGAQGGFL